MKNVEATAVFLRTSCPLPGNWCYGGAIPKAGRKPWLGLTPEEREPCEYLSPGKGCTHPENPKFSTDSKPK